jgi:endonuclease YncB( thermonuclease family)
VVEWKDKIVEVEKEKVVHERPTVSINSLKVTLIRVIDADTAVFDIELPLHLKMIDQHIRCTGYDGFELSEVNGLAAKQAFEDLLKDSDIYIIIDPKEKDNFGRILAAVFCRKNDKIIPVAEYMTSHSFSKPTK